MKKISVVVCVYNRADIIERCLNSILQQDFEDFDIVVVDDGSTDRTGDIVNKLKASNKIKVYRNEKNLGLLKSRNVGADRAEGTIIAYTDSDCVVEKDWLGKLAAPFDRDPAIAIVGGRILDGFTGGYWSIVSKGLYKIGSASGYADRIFGGNMAFRKEFLSNNRFDEMFTYYADEADLCRRAHKAGLKVYYAAEAKVTHFHRSTLKGVVRQRVLTGIDNFLFRLKYRMIPPVSVKSLVLLVGLILLIIYAFCQDKNMLIPALLSLLGYIGIVFYEDARTGEKDLGELVVSLPGRLIIATCESLGYYLGIVKYFKLKK